MMPVLVLLLLAMAPYMLLALLPSFPLQFLGLVFPLSEGWP